jgi:hypothetical protein
MSMDGDDLDDIIGREVKLREIDFTSLFFIIKDGYFVDYRAVVRAAGQVNTVGLWT